MVTLLHDQVGDWGLVIRLQLLASFPNGDDLVDFSKSSYKVSLLLCGLKHTVLDRVIGKDGAGIGTHTNPH